MMSVVTESGRQVLGQIYLTFALNWLTSSAT